MKATEEAGHYRDIARTSAEVRAGQPEPQYRASVVSLPPCGGVGAGQLNGGDRAMSQALDNKQSGLEACPAAEVGSDLAQRSGEYACDISGD